MCNKQKQYTICAKCTEYPWMAYHTVGVTKFDLLGHFGDIKWIRNRWLVLSYNVMFGSLTGLVIIKKVTSTLIREAYHAFRIHKWKNIVVNRKYHRLKSSQSD